MAKEAMTGIYDRGHIPILTGGTGFYIQAVLYDIDFTKESGVTHTGKNWRILPKDPEQKRSMKRLAAVDPKAAKDIHPHNIKRVIRRWNTITRREI